MAFKKLCGLILLIFALTPSWAMETSATDGVKNKQMPVDAKAANTTNMPTDPIKPIVVKSISPTFSIRLPGNGSTGYQWYLADYNPRFVRLLDQQYIVTPVPKDFVGGPGVSVWQFQLQQIAFTAPQVTHIMFEYRRSWEPKAVKKESFIVISQQPGKDG